MKKWGTLWLLILQSFLVLGCTHPAAFQVVFVTDSDAAIAPMSFDSAMILPTPEKTGHSFVGWYVDEERQVPFRVEDFVSSRLTGDLVIYAKWEVNRYVISYFLQGDSSGTLPLSVGEAVLEESLGTFHSAILTSEGRLFVWGRNSYGQLGDGTEINRSAPVEITGNIPLSVGEKIVGISLGNVHSGILTSEGRLFLWGRNDCGQIGDETMTNRSLPTEITSRFPLQEGEVLVGMTLGLDHSSAWTSAGRLFLWGHNYSGQIGDGTTTDRMVPTEITANLALGPGEGILDVVLGDYHSSVLTSAGRLLIWGRNNHGQLGDGTLTEKTVSLDITQAFGLREEETILGVSLGDAHSSAWTSEGRLFVWGQNNYGQIGDGSVTDILVPTDITGAFGLRPDEGIAEASLGAKFTAARTTEGRVFLWGHNNNGQLGDGSGVDRTIPGEITPAFGLSGNGSIVEISLGGYHSMAVTSTGGVFLWGWNQYGQMGNETTEDQSVPDCILSFSWNLWNETERDFQGTMEECIPIVEGSAFSGWYEDGLFRSPFRKTSMPDMNLSVFGYLISEGNGPNV